MVWVNNDLSDKDSYPQKFVLDNLISGENVRIIVQFYDREEKKILWVILKDILSQKLFL